MDKRKRLDRLDREKIAKKLFELEYFAGTKPNWEGLPNAGNIATYPPFGHNKQTDRYFKEYWLLQADQILGYLSVYLFYIRKEGKDSLTHQKEKIEDIIETGLDSYETMLACQIPEKFAESRELIKQRGAKNLLALFPGKQKRLDRPKLREKIRKIFLDYDQAVKNFMATFEKHPSISKAINAVVALIPDIEELREQSNKMFNRAKELLVEVEEAKKQERRNTILELEEDGLLAHEIKGYGASGRKCEGTCESCRLLQALKGGEKKLKCEDCGWVGLEEECTRKYEGVYGTGGDVEPCLVCPNCQGNYLVPLGEEVQLDT